MAEVVFSPTPAAATGVRRAVIDVGTNSVKMLLGAVQGAAVLPIVERSQQTRLGAGLFETGRLQPDAIARTAEAVGGFLAEMEHYGPERIRLVATAAAREAGNRADLVEALRQASGLETEIISGDEEAELAFRGVGTDPRWAGQPMLVTDLGGGSTEFIVGQSGVRHFSRSFPLGVVRLFESVKPSPQPTSTELEQSRSRVREQLRTDIEPWVKPALQTVSAAGAKPIYVAVGGTAVILARIAGEQASFDRALIEAEPLSASKVSQITERLWSLSLVERRGIVGLPPERADIIPGGAVIYEGILGALDLPALYPCTRGLRYAALLDPQ
ncbi:MAG: hypothetical protein IT581_09995 [Verrucomicrobiales bacterium]|nr:hypothetical protein [Verrucomicrobiales bacterium]